MVKAAVKAGAMTFFVLSFGMDFFHSGFVM